jgi:hypothetical protein
MTARTRLLLDLAMFGALLLAYNPVWTGLAVHEWLSVAAFAALLFHVIVNWDWTMQVVRRFSVLLKAMPRVNLVVDTALFVAVVGVMVSGLMVSAYVAPAIGLAVVPTRLWARVHSVTADATIALLLVHFVLHWRWIAKTARRLGRAAPSAAARPVVPDPAAPAMYVSARITPRPRPEGGR